MLKLLTVIAWWVHKQKKSPQSLRREDHEETPLWALRDSNPRPSACKAESAYFSLFYYIFIYSYKILFFSHKYTIFIFICFSLFTVIFYFCVEVVLKLC